MNKVTKLTIFIFLIYICSQAIGSEVIYLGRSPKALLMGDAWTAISNNDEMTLFYNPASLGANDSVDFHPLNAKFGLTNALGEMDRFKDFPKEAAGISDRILGLPLYLEAATFPGLKMAHFGFSLFATNKTSMILKNKIHPILDVDYRYDKGFTTGFAFNLIGDSISRGKKISSGSRLSIGYGLKFINREGLKNRFDLFGTGLLTTINNGTSDVAALKNSLGYSTGKAFGHDLGIEYATGFGNMEFIASSSILDIGDTRFRKLSGDEDVPMQEMYWNTGFALKHDFGFFDYNLTMDIKPINAPIPIARMFHFGINLNIPFFSFFGGWSEGYLSYGAEIRIIPLVNITLGFYGVELGAEYKEVQGKRAFIYFSLFDASFDIF